MTQLPENIKMSEIRALLQENKGVLGFKEYFREQAKSCLEKRGRFVKDDFEYIINDIEKKKNRIVDMFKYNFSRNNISNELINEILRLYLSDGYLINEFYFGDSDIIYKVFSFGKEKNIINILKLCKSNLDFENILSIDGIIASFIGRDEDEIELFIFVHEIIDVLRLDFDDYQKISKTFIGVTKKNPLVTKNNIGENYDLLFPVESGGSQVFDELKEKIGTSPDNDIHDIMRKEISDFLNFKNITIEETGNIELAIYLRYSHTVSYPEIGELIIIFMQEAIKLGIIKGVKGIKILPRKKFILPRKSILDTNTRFCNVKGRDFIEEFNTNSIPIYLSHSRNQTPSFAVVSSSMERKKGQISLGLELEKQKDEIKTDKKTMKDIFDILMGIIGEINNRNI